MHRVERSVIVPFSIRQMFELVARVEDYPQFLPWCPATRVQRQAATPANYSHIMPEPSRGSPGRRVRRGGRWQHARPTQSKMRLEHFTRRAKTAHCASGQPCAVL